MNTKKLTSFLLRVLKTLILPVLVFVIFAALSGGRTTSTRMILNTIRQSIIPMLLCWGLMMTMSLGMMNFTGGAVMIASGIIGGNLASMTGTGIPGLIFFCVLCGLLSGVLTGVLYNALRVPCMVLTIGLMLFFEALPRILYSGGVRFTTVTALSMAPSCYYVGAIMLIVFYMIYNQTALGHNMQALGASPQIAANVGLDADKIKLKAFILSGLFFGVAAAMYTSSNGEIRNVSALGSMLTMMDAFMGMFLAMFMSAFCNMGIAVVVSAFTMKLMSNGLVALGMDATVRDLANGVFLLVLLAISANAGMFSRMRANRQFQAEALKEAA